MSWIEIAGTIFGLLCVWLTARESIWCWPTGIANIVLFAGDMALPVPTGKSDCHRHPAFP